MDRYIENRKKKLVEVKKHLRNLVRELDTLDDIPVHQRTEKEHERFETLSSKRIELERMHRDLSFVHAPIERR